MITLLVDKLDNDYRGAYRTRIVTPGFEEDKHYEGWHRSNTEQINLFSESNFFSIKNVEDFDSATDANPFYVISMTGGDSWEPKSNDTSIWSKIPQTSKNYILQHNISILIFYPFETTSGLNSNKKFANFIKEKDKNGFKNIKTIIFSLSNFNDYYGNPKFGSYTDHNVYYVSSSLFFDKMKRELTSDKFANQFCNNDEVNSNLNLKKYDFLCLNHIARPNRQLLSQALYRDDSLWNNNLISVLIFPEKKSEVRLRFIENFCSFVETEKKLIKDSRINDFFRFYKQGNGFKRLFDKLKNMSHDPKLTEQDLINELFSDYQNLKDSKFLNFVCQHIAGIMYKGVYPVRTMKTEQELGTGKRACATTKLNMSWDKEWYKETWFSLITETYAEEQKINRTDEPAFAGSELTEKTTKPIANFHPFIIFGSSGATKKLETLGFKTFNKSLLGIPDDFEEGNIATTERLMNLIEGLKRFEAKTYDEKQKILTSIKPDIEHNYYHLLNTDWIKVVHDDLLNQNLPLLPIDHEEMID